ncbi:Pr6Pr family membrane protein, partial [Mycobacterium tuberculosis]|nr:Pr6Pr family membrane protein [Mycobacterium tuberculosis]
MATLRFVGYCTILSNLAVCLGCVRLIRAGVLNATVAAAIALCIGVTACIYVLALQGLWQPTGLQWWVDAGLHYAVLALYLLGWWWLLPHGALRWRALGGVLL